MNGFRVIFTAVESFGFILVTLCTIGTVVKSPGQFYMTELRYGETMMINNLLVSNLWREDRNEV